jgi:hypothetical protein
MRPIVVAIIAACVVSVQADAQQPTANAALRYWMAFALLQDPPADTATTDLIQRVADGTAPWDEGRLGAILDANAGSLEIMRRASTLRSCDWGIEYELGPNAPIGHLAKGRVLGRLNTLSGMRLAARGQLVEAIDVWLAGVRFAQHLAQGGTLVSLLSANSILIPNLNALSNAASRQSLNSDQRNRIQTVVRALPETGFDWADAMRRDGDVLVAGVRANTIPNLTTKDVDGLRATVTRIADALHLPPDRSRSALASVNLGSFPLPSPTRINDVRENTRAARQKALGLPTR